MRFLPFDEREARLIKKDFVFHYNKEKRVGYNSGGSRMINEENRGMPVNDDVVFFPFGGRERDDEFIVRVGDVAGHAEGSVGMERVGEQCEEFRVAVWSLDKNMRHVVSGAVGFQAFNGGHACLGVDWEIAVESETLAVEAGSHQGKENAGGADERHDLEAFALSDVDDGGARVGDSGTSGLAHNPYGLTFSQRFEIQREVFGICVLIEFKESQFIDDYILIAAFEKSSRGSDVFYNKKLNIIDDGDIEIRQYIPQGGVTDIYREEIKSW